MSDLLSYFRRGPAKGKRRPVPVAEEDAIDLESMGGEISNVYLDIASAGAPAEKPRRLAPEKHKDQPERRR